MFLSQNSVILISLVSSSTTAQQIIPKMPAVLHINQGVLWTPFVSSNLFNHNYYITDAITQASLNMHLATTRYSYKLTTFTA